MDTLSRYATGDALWVIAGGRVRKLVYRGYVDSDALPLSRATIDRDALIRTEPAELQKIWSDPRLRLLRVNGFELAVNSASSATAPVALALEDVPEEVRLQQYHALAEGDDTADYWYLGRDIEGPVVASAGSSEEVGTFWDHLRSIGVLLAAREAGLATVAVALANWHDTHRHCPRCGTPTRVIAAGWVRLCPRDNSEHYPRTDSAVIMAIVDSFDRILLAHNALWHERRYSVPAGYVEPGEPLEAAVRREVWEETAVRVGEVAYQGSQPWPFPASLMVAFRGEALTNDPRPDGEEITDAYFITRGELHERVLAGELLLPQGTSIARALLEDWYGGPIPEPTTSPSV